jgi:hypothetical protein
MERPGTGLAELGETVRVALMDDLAEAHEIRQVREEMLQRFAVSSAQKDLRGGGLARHGRLFLLAGVTTAGVLALWMWMRMPITFEVAGTPGRSGDLVSAAPEAPTTMRFSEGSSLQLHRGGRVRVLAMDDRGARVLVEHGVVDAAIAPAWVGKKRWRFEVGQFTVEVTGTKFQIDYDSVEQTFGLATTEGRVLVSGACLDTPRPVSAGERVDLFCLGKTRLRELAASTDREPPPPEPLDERPRPIATNAPAPAGMSWSALLASGRLHEGLLAAEHGNFGRICQTATAKDLLSLGETARLFRRTARASTALLALRRRFPSAPEASTAAFALGRIAVEQKRVDAEAIKWFSAYLQEQPNGPLMGDAMGRLMEAHIRSGDGSGAYAEAQQYLRRFPDGPYASQARGILAK